jgi:excisionase family DNA binding protein
MTRELQADLMPMLLRVGEASQQLNLGRSVMYELIRSGRLRSVKVGRLRLIPASALVEFVRELEADGAA